MKIQRKRTGPILSTAITAAVAGTALADKHMQKLLRAGESFDVLYADPPWNYGRSSASNSGKAAPQKHYPCMSTGDIAGLPIKQISAKDAVMLLWAPNCLLVDGIRVLSAYGFKYKTHIVWAKPTHCPSNGLVLPTHEILLVGYRGKGVKRAFGQRCIRSVFAMPKGGKRLRHSEKPEHFAAEIERVFPEARKIELFARRRRRGWTVWGNQSSPGTNPLLTRGRAEGRSRSVASATIAVTSSRRRHARSTAAAGGRRGGAV